MARPRSRGNGEGSIYQRSDGRWCATVSIGYDATGTLRRRTVYGKTRKEAAEKLLKLKHDQSQGRAIEPNKITVAEHFGDWLQEKKLSNRASTWARDEAHVRNHIVPQLGHVRLRDLSHRHITEFYLYLQEETELADRTIFDIASALRSALKNAVEKKLIHESPAALIPKPPKGDREARFLDQDELQRLLAAAKGERLEYLFITLAHTGLRPGEALGLTWDQIDLDTGRIAVVQALHEINGHLSMGEAKTKASRRTISLSRTAITALRRQRKQQLEEQLGSGGAWSNRDGLVFTNTEGGYLRRSHVLQRDLRRICKRAGLEGVTLHTFRHTHASLLIFSGVDIKTVSRRLGHANITVTLQTYGHLLPGQDERASKAMDAMLGSL